MANRRRRVVWSPSARQALDDAVSYIAKDSPDSALRVLDEALDTATGCNSKTVRLGENSRPMTVVLRCSKAGSQ